jgi:hypothetical protein
MLEKTEGLFYKTGIHVGSNNVANEYQFVGKDVVNAINKLAKPHP